MRRMRKKVSKIPGRAPLAKINLHAMSDDDGTREIMSQEAMGNDKYPTLCNEKPKAPFFAFCKGLGVAESFGDDLESWCDSEVSVAASGKTPPHPKPRTNLHMTITVKRLIVTLIHGKFQSVAKEHMIDPKICKT